MADALSHQKESLVSIQQTEHEHLRQATGFTVASVPEKKRGSKPFVLFFGAFLLLAFAAFGCWYTYGEFVRKTAPPVVSAPTNRFFAVESSVNFNFASSTKEAFVEFSAANATTKPGAITQLVLRDGEGSAAPLTTTSNLFNKLGTQAPSSLIRAFDPLFMLGSLGLPDQAMDTNSRFVVIKLSSFQNAYAGMLAWEQSIVTDITSALLSTVSLTQFMTAESVFKDIVYKNKDVRALGVTIGGEATTTAPVLLYSFFDNQFLIITDRYETLDTLIERLTRDKLTR